MRRFQSFIRARNWQTVIVELLVLVLGLFIGLQLDTWWEGRKELRNEATYIAELTEDFVENGNRLTVAKSLLEQIIRSMVVLQEQAAQPIPTLPTKELNAHFSQVQTMPAFFVLNRAFSNLTGSGDLKIIRNRALKNSLATYYAEADQIQMVQQTHEFELVQSFQPSIIENLDYAAISITLVEDFPVPPAVDEDRINEVLSTRLFRNITMQKWTICSDLLNLLRNQSDRNDEVLRLLGADAGSGQSD
jgi:hypothetical protein